MEDSIFKSMFLGLYFAKFEKEAVTKLGFTGFNDAFNALGLALNINSNSIRLCRDEFAVAFPTKRKGFHKREINSKKKRFLQEFQSLTFTNFTLKIKESIFTNKTELDLDIFEEEIENTTFAKRLITGKSAENYFVENYNKIDIFKDFSLTNVTQYGCGYDFKLECGDKMFCIEVKGLSAKTGSVMLTEKEHKVATKIKDNYFIFLVKNFIKEPEFEYYKNPLQHERLSFVKKEKTILQINYLSKV